MIIDRLLLWLSRAEWLKTIAFDYFPLGGVYEKSAKLDLRTLGIGIVDGDKLTYFYKDYKRYCLVDFADDKKTVLFFEMSKHSLQIDDKIFLNKLGVFDERKYNERVS